MYRFGTCLVLLMSCFEQGCAWSSSYDKSWHREVKRQVRELGFRNWIVIAESSFPAYSRPRASQVAAEAESPEVLSYVLQVIAETQHVRPNVFLTRELRSMSNDTAPGIDEWKRKTQQALLGMETTSLEQESLMSLVADANRSFEVLVVRTSSALPYSSIFIELQPGYWDAEAEQQLRARIEQERQQFKRSAAKNL
ncbi:MAG: hypothetical protein RLZZ224_1873 [Verrucomicrobiota bacterium]|jgi:D-ribose pyranose/furanose isomerase RbsD